MTMVDDRGDSDRPGHDGVRNPGPDLDPRAERLGWSDKGVILFRSVVFEQMEKVARGEDPLGVLRDPADDVMIRIPRESKAHYVVGEFIAADDENMKPAIQKEYSRTAR